MAGIYLEKWFGLTGINCNEDVAPRRCWRYFRHATSAIVLLLAVQWQMSTKGTLPPTWDIIINWVVWLFFASEFFALLLMVNHKARFIFQNLTLIIIIVGGIPFLFHYKPFEHLLAIFRPLLVALLLIPWIDICRDSLMDNKLGTTLVSAFIITMLAGIFISGFDPGIPTLWDGIWWAWVSVSTVGYGDVVPISPLGRVFGALLILMGLLLFTVLIANFSAIFVEREEHKARKRQFEILKVLKEIQEVRKDEDEILEALKDIQKQIKQSKIGKPKNPRYHK